MLCILSIQQGLQQLKTNKDCMQLRIATEINVHNYYVHNSSY